MMANRRRRAGTQSRQSPAPTVESTQSSSPAPQLALPNTGPAPRTRRTATRRAARGATREATPRSSGEEIDLDGIGPDSGDEAASLSDRAEPAANSLEPSPAQSVVQLVTARADPRRANDVWHFFERGSEKENKYHLCHKCK